MQTHELKLKNAKKRKKRVGRGVKRGTTSGKGQKGQKARSGSRMRPAERDIISKLPKLRGVKNKSRREPATELNVGNLGKTPSAENWIKLFWCRKKSSAGFQSA